MNSSNALTRPLDDLGALYHDYRLFGVANTQLPGIFAANQSAKEPVIVDYIRRCLMASRVEVDQPVTFAELFCADGYYAMVARYLGADESYGIDNDREGHFANAPRIAERLGLTHMHFIKEEVSHIDQLPRVDIVANLGGLYHVANPIRILEKSYAMAKKFLIVQSVVSLRHESADYFEAPAPGWDWGCRFSRGWLERRIDELGGELLAKDFNELPGNDRPEDRGSAYFLVQISN